VTSSGKEDKPEVAARVKWSGVGVRLNTETPSAAEVRTAVHQVLDDARYRTAAQTIAASMARSGGMTELARIVDRLSAEETAPESRR
jgi:UDP:flavonoid glycosyltransferase YjiC (YdhE family)